MTKSQVCAASHKVTKASKVNVDVVNVLWKNFADVNAALREQKQITITFSNNQFISLDAQSDEKPGNRI